MTCALVHLAGRVSSSALRASEGLLSDVLLAGRQMELSALRGIGLVPMLLAGWMGKVAAAAGAEGLLMRSKASGRLTCKIGCLPLIVRQWLLLSKLLALRQWLLLRKLLSLRQWLLFRNLLALHQRLLPRKLLALRQWLLLSKLLALRQRLLMRDLLALRWRKVNSCRRMPDSCLTLDTRSWLRSNQGLPGRLHSSARLSKVLPVLNSLLALETWRRCLLAGPRGSDVCRTRTVGHELLAWRKDAAVRDCRQLHVIATVVLSSRNHHHAALQQYLSLSMHCTTA